jgi:dipeptidyl aminopeptidase/acylaminoacyl peptidase
MWSLACLSIPVEGQSDANPTPAPHVFDPVTHDLSHFDFAHPPVIREVSFYSDGANLNAIVYVAQGRGPHPTVLLLHGFPGNERNLDLAQAIRRAGWNVVFFHYRGAWGSGGQFSFLHVIEDVGEVVRAIRQPAFAETHRIDVDRLTLVGHSMGGFASLVAGAELDAVDCIVSIAGANLGGLARSLDEDAQVAAGFAASVDGWSGPIKGPGGEALVEEITRHADRFETTSHAEQLASKKLLLIAGARDVVTPADVHHAPLVQALERAGADSLEASVFEFADHSFSGQRIALARLVTNWLQQECRATD